MAKRLQIAPEAQAALDELTRAYGGTLPARLSIFWLRNTSEGGSVQIADPSSPTGQFEIPVNDLAEGRLEPWILGHPALGGSRSYRLLVFLPKPDGTYPPKPNRSIQLSYVDPAENQAAVEASRAAQAAATLAAATVAADAVMDAAQGAVAGVAAKSPPDVADKLQESLSQFSTVMGNVMSTVNRFQTPLPSAPAAQPAPGMTFYPPPSPYGYPPMSAPYGYPPMAPPPATPDTKLADALVSLVTAKPAAPAAPATDPAILQILQQQGQLLAKIAENIAAPKVVAPAGPSPEMAALIARVDAAERAGAEARAQLAQQQIRAEAEREKLELRQQLAELKNRIEGGSGRPDPALEFAKIQMQQQGENARMFQAMLERSQQQANEFNRELRELMAAPGPDQGAQFKQLASAMGEINNTAMSMMSSMMRMGIAGGGGGEANKKPAWAEPAERMIGILAGLGQSIMASTQAPAEPEPQPEPQQLRVASERPPRPQLAPAQESPQLAAAPAPAPAPSEQGVGQQPRAPRSAPPAEDFIGRARQLAQGSDFIGAIRTLRAAFQYYPTLIRNDDEIRTVATLLDGIEWPVTTTAEAIEGAYVAVYGEPVREHLQRLVSEERAKAAGASSAPPAESNGAAPSEENELDLESSEDDSTEQVGHA